MCYLSSSVLYILEKQKAVFSQNSLVRKIIFEITQKLPFWQCFDWISHFLWPVCAQVVAIFSFSYVLCIWGKKSPICTVQSHGSLEEELKSGGWDHPGTLGWIGAAALLNCWTISATMGEYLFPHICQDQVLDCEECSLLLLLPLNRILLSAEKKGILGSPRARFNLFCWQNMLRQAFLNNNIFMAFLEVGGVGERICPEWFFSPVAHTSVSKQRNV